MNTAITSTRAIVFSALLGVQYVWAPSLCVAQTPPTPAPTAQPSYPSAPAPRARVNPPPAAVPQKPAESRCANLKGLEKSECERRDTANDNAPAGVTPSMRQKQEEENRTDTSSDPASDTAKTKPSETASSDADAKMKEARTRDEAKAKTNADDADTLGKPPR